MLTLHELKEQVEGTLAATLKWNEDSWFGGSAWAEYDDGQVVSVMVEPPTNCPQIYYHPQAWSTQDRQPETFESPAPETSADPKACSVLPLSPPPTGPEEWTQLQMNL